MEARVSCILFVIAGDLFILFFFDSLYSGLSPGASEPRPTPPWRGAQMIYILTYRRHLAPHATYGNRQSCKEV